MTSRSIALLAVAALTSTACATADASSQAKVGAPFGGASAAVCVIDKSNPTPSEAAAMFDEGSEQAAHIETIRTACQQVRAGEEPDRPDVVECYERSDEPTSIIAGEIPFEFCDRLAMQDEVGDVDELVRDGN